MKRGPARILVRIGLIVGIVVLMYHSAVFSMSARSYIQEQFSYLQATIVGD